MMRGVAILLGLLVAEGLARAVVFLRLRHGPPPNFGLQPPLLARLVYAYSGGGFSTISADCDHMVPDAHRGYRHAPGLRDRQLHGSTLSTNSRGMRGAHEYAVPKPASITRIVALGDSLTFGEGVPDDATWPAQLEAALPGTEVANLGERAYAHDQMYFALVDDGVPLAPDVVILGFYDNDVWRDDLLFYGFEKPRFSFVGGQWIVENVPVPTPREDRARYLAMPLLYAVPRGLFDAYREPSADSHGARAREVLRWIARATEDAGARFILVNLPEHPDEPVGDRGFFYEYCARAGAECVDPWPLFHTMAGTDDAAALRERYLRPHDIHYSRAGYGVVAEALRRHLTTHAP
jgi:lysophospholipase L1-like esterase